MKKTGIFYSFHSNKTSKVAEKIHEAFGKEQAEAVNIEEVTSEQFISYDNLILGVSTWFDGELPNYWDEFVPALKELDLKGKTVAIFGLADQKGYPENFADGVGILGKLMKERGASLIGYTSTEKYDFESSNAVENDQFMGLVLDQENQARMTRGRIDQWVKIVKNELK